MEERVCLKPRKKDKKKRIKFIKPQLDEIEEEIESSKNTHIYHDAAQSVFSELTNTLLQGSTTDSTNINDSILDEVAHTEDIAGGILNEIIDFIDYHETPQLLPVNTKDANCEALQLDQNELDLTLETEVQKQEDIEHDLPRVLENLESDTNIFGDNKCPAKVTLRSKSVNEELQDAVINFYQNEDKLPDLIQKRYFQTTSLEIIPMKNTFVTKCANIQNECALQSFVSTHLKSLTEIEILKPSVFIDKGKSHSLEISYQWDHKKYNPVLKPDLSKIVYPDLDLFLNWSQKPNHRYSPRNDSINSVCTLPKVGFDRKQKPEPVGCASRPTLPTKELKARRFKSSETYEPEIPAPDSPTLPMKSQSTEKWNPKRKKATSSPPNVGGASSFRFKDSYNNAYATDFSFRDVKLIVYMKPLKWNPLEGQQLVLFKVNSIYYEEFFSKCDNSTCGLIQAIRNRAIELSDKQKQLEARKYTPLSSTLVSPQTIPIKDSHTVKIHSLPAIWKQKNEKRHVLFEVGGIFYEEDFTHCKSNLELIKALKERAECLLEQQQKLHNKTKTGWSMTDFEEEDTSTADDDVFFSYTRDLISNGMTNIGMSSDSSVDESNPAAVSHERKTLFQSFKNWLKNPFRKKSVKKQDSQANPARIPSIPSASMVTKQGTMTGAIKTDENKRLMERLVKCKSSIEASTPSSTENPRRISVVDDEDSYVPQMFLPPIPVSAGVRRYAGQNRIGRLFQR